MLAIGEIAPAVVGQPPPCPALLAFFKTDCPACHLGLRCLDGAVRYFDGRATVVTISQDGPAETDRLVQSLGLRVPVVFDQGLKASRAYRIEAVPALVLVDGRGRVAAISQGFDKSDLNRLVAELSARSAVSPPAAIRSGDGTPDFQPGCVSRHLEPPSEGEGVAVAGVYAGKGLRASRITVPAGTEPEEFCYENGFADPLPVIPPTVARVDRMLAATGQSPDEVVAHVPPNFGPATVEKIAANAVMAGCLPEYMRVLVPAVRALCDERLDIHGVQGTTHFAAPLAVINGPIRTDLGFACGSNVFSNTARANSTIGRALQLILRNLGGAAPGQIDMSTMGNPGRFSYVIGENEEASPWEPLSEYFGIGRGTDAVTFFCCEPPRPVSEHKARTADVVLTAVCPVLANLWSRRVCGRHEALVVVGPEHAATIARSGFSKHDVRSFLFENTGIPLREYDTLAGEGSADAGSYEECTIRGERCYRKFRSPDAIRVMVAGGPAGKFSAVLGSWSTGQKGSQMVCHVVE